MKEGNRELNVEEMAGLSYITSYLVVELVQRTKMLPARMVLHWVRQVSSEVWCGHALVVWLTTPACFSPAERGYMGGTLMLAAQRSNHSHPASSQV